LTRLDDAALLAMAQAGGGRYVAVESGGLSGLPSEFDSLDTTTFASEETATPIERFQIFAAIALGLAVAAIVVTAIRWPRVRGAARLWPVGGAVLFIGAICAADAADANRRGNREYAAGEYASAVDAYRTAQALDPERAELYHNAGNAFDQLGQYATAIDETNRALSNIDEGDPLRAVFEYALGGHYAGATQLQDALESYKRSLLANPDDIDAKHNLEVIIRKLTPTATPSPAITAPAGEATPPPSDPSQPQGTPENGGTPEPGASPQPGQDSDIPPEQLERELEEALAGIDEQFTVEEALRVLELIERQNRDELDERRIAPGGLPDY
jgi:tetratricopeptide (TPR) repeat protein